MILFYPKRDPKTAISVEKLEDFLEKQGFVNFFAQDHKRFNSEMFHIFFDHNDSVVAKYIPTEKIICECCGHILASDFFRLKCPDLYIIGEYELWSQYISPVLDIVGDDVRTLLNNMEPSYCSRYALFSLISGVWDIHGKNLIADYDDKPYVIDFEHIHPNSSIVSNGKLFSYFCDWTTKEKIVNDIYPGHESFLIARDILWKSVNYYSLEDLYIHVKKEDINEIQKTITFTKLKLFFQPILNKFPAYSGFVSRIIYKILNRIETFVGILT